MEALKLILEKIKSGAISIEEGVLLIKTIFEASGDKSSGKDDGAANKERFEERVEDSVRKIFDTVMSKENKDEFLRFKGKMEKELKDTLKDWVNK